MYKNPIELLEKEEKDLEQMIYGAPTDTSATTEDVTTEQDPTVAEAPQVPGPVPQAQEPEAPQGTEDWEKRYKNLRASRDENLWKTKTQLTAALDTITTLQGELGKLRQAAPSVDPLEGVFTQEDTDTLGEATVEAMKKATKRATEIATQPLKVQLEEERKRRLEQDRALMESSKQEAYNIFLSRISTAVPNWEAINYDPNFAKFMEDPDYDGTPRKNYFHSAEAQGNAALVIRYMKEFEASQGKRPDALASKVSPVGDLGSTQAPQQKAAGEQISRAYIDKFYDDVTRGRYRGRQKEADAIEAAIDKAVMEGRVV
jgi:hypothetical protein